MQLALGVDYDLPPVALVAERTVWFPAGAVTFGLEERAVGEAALRAAFTDEQRAGSAIADVHDDAFRDDGGLSVHVCDTASRRELLRFDCFAVTPHYHYLPVGGGNRAVAFDTDANGEMIPWVATCLLSRLAVMLTRVGAGYLAARLDPAAVEAAVTALLARAERWKEEQHGQAR